jgi:hypothetical protein
MDKPTELSSVLSKRQYDGQQPEFDEELIAYFPLYNADLIENETIRRRTQQVNLIGVKCNGDRGQRTERDRQKARSHNPPFTFSK